MQRMMLSVVLAFLVGALLGKLLLPVLYKLKFGQNIYELAPEAHRKKQGTPIMGGLAFAGAAILIGLLIAGLATIAGPLLVIGLLAAFLLPRVNN